MTTDKPQWVRGLGGEGLSKATIAVIAIVIVTLVVVIINSVLTTNENPTIQAVVTAERSPNGSVITVKVINIGMDMLNIQGITFLNSNNQTISCNLVTARVGASFLNPPTPPSSTSPQLLSGESVNAYTYNCGSNGANVHYVTVTTSAGTIQATIT